jgi:hypothetical protein
VAAVTGTLASSIESLIESMAGRILSDFIDKSAEPDGD